MICVYGHEHTQTHRHFRFHTLQPDTLNPHWLTLIGCAARQLHPRHSPQSSGETGSDWLIPSAGNGSQTAPRWFLSHKPGGKKSRIAFVIYKPYLNLKYSHSVNGFNTKESLKSLFISVFSSILCLSHITQPHTLFSLSSLHSSEKIFQHKSLGVASLHPFDGRRASQGGQAACREAKITSKNRLVPFTLCCRLLSLTCSSISSSAPSPIHC